MLHCLDSTPSLLNVFVAQLRNAEVQQDRMRFRRNLERIGEVAAIELSKALVFEAKEVTTPFGTANMPLPAANPVVVAILRAGLPLQQGVLNAFDAADAAFISAYRKHNPGRDDFEIVIEYLACPPLTNRPLIITDPMLATGRSAALCYKALLSRGTPESVHIVAAVASRQGIDYVQRIIPNAHLWVAAIDPELDAKSYIIPGLGDAGDLAFGPRL